MSCRNMFIAAFVLGVTHLQGLEPKMAFVPYSNIRHQIVDGGYIQGATTFTLHVHNAFSRCKTGPYLYAEIGKNGVTMHAWIDSDDTCDKRNKVQPYVDFFDGSGQLIESRDLRTLPFVTKPTRPDDYCHAISALLDPVAKIKIAEIKIRGGVLDLYDADNVQRGTLSDFKDVRERCDELKKYTWPYLDLSEAKCTDIHKIPAANKVDGQLFLYSKAVIATLGIVSMMSGYRLYQYIKEKYKQKQQVPDKKNITNGVHSCL